VSLEDRSFLLEDMHDGGLGYFKLSSQLRSSSSFEERCLFDAPFDIIPVTLEFAFAPVRYLSLEESIRNVAIQEDIVDFFLVIVILVGRNIFQSCLHLLPQTRGGAFVNQKTCRAIGKNGSWRLPTAGQGYHHAMLLSCQPP